MSRRSVFFRWVVVGVVVVKVVVGMDDLTTIPSWKSCSYIYFFFNGDILLSSFFPLGSSLFFQGVIALSAEECPENLEPSFSFKAITILSAKKSHWGIQYHITVSCIDSMTAISIYLNDLVNLKLAHLISWNILEICNGHIYSVFENIICDGKDSFYSIIS